MPHRPLLVIAVLAVLYEMLPLQQSFADETQSQSVTQITVTPGAYAPNNNVSAPSVPSATGATTYTEPAAVLENEPQGEERPFDQVLEQAPGFAQDSFGQVHLRNEHANLQYRIDDIQLPDGVSGFSELFDTRFADSISILTGTLPAEYGYRTSGVVSITTKQGSYEDSGLIDMYGGGHQTLEPSFQMSGTTATGLAYFGTGQYLQTNEGIENPTASYNPVHDQTRQGSGFAYAAQPISDEMKLSAMVGSSSDYFQIPDNPGQPQEYAVTGSSDVDSSHLNQRQDEFDHFALMALNGTGDRFSYQIAPFFRYAETDFAPDAIGDLAFSGVADRTQLTSASSGVQMDSTYVASGTHTLRAGVYFQSEHTGYDETANVFGTTAGTVNAFGNVQDSATPLTIVDGSNKTGTFYGLYARDEWRVTDFVTVNYGLRYDQIDAYTDENQLSPRLNVVYKPSEDTTFHAGYARDFTPPPQELVSTPSLAKFAGTTQAPTVAEDSPVKAEREHSFDVGGIQTLLPGWTAGLDGYYKIKRNLLDEGQFGESLIYSPFNYAFGQAYGIEATSSFKADGFTTYANLAYGREKGKDIVSGQYFFTAPELAYIATHSIYTDHSQLWTASAGESYAIENASGTLTPALDLIFGSGLRKDPDNGTIDPNGAHLTPYAQLNFGTVQTFDATTGWLHGMTVRFDIVNVTDRIYEIRNGTGVGVGAPQFGPRRTFYMGLSRAF